MVSTSLLVACGYWSGSTSLPVRSAGGGLGPTGAPATLREARTKLTSKPVGAASIIVSGDQ